MIISFFHKLSLNFIILNFAWILKNQSPSVNMEVWKERIERAIQGRKVIGSLGRVMRERTVSKEVKKALRNSIIVPTVAYASETWVWNQSQRSKIQAVETSYLRGGCGVNRMDGKCNENVYRKFGLSSRGEGMSCGVVEMVKRSTQMVWTFGRMDERELTKRIYRSKVDDGNVRG